MKKASAKSDQKSTRRPLGLYRGQIWMAPDFDAPMEFIEVDGDMVLVSERSSVTKKKGKKLKSTRKSAQP